MNFAFECLTLSTRSRNVLNKQQSCSFVHLTKMEWKINYSFFFVQVLSIFDAVGMKTWNSKKIDTISKNRRIGNILKKISFKIRKGNTSRTFAYQISSSLLQIRWVYFSYKNGNFLFSWMATKKTVQLCIYIQYIDSENQQRATKFLKRFYSELFKLSF